MLNAGNQSVDLVRWMPALLGAAALLQLLVARRRFRQTTMATPFAWGAASIIGISFAGLAAGSGSHLHAFVEYACAVLVLTPGLAVVGAKRPQSAAWQWIVLTLAVVLLLPALRSGLAGEAEPNVHILFRWLNLLILAIALCNFAATSYGVAAALVWAGMGCIAYPWLPGGTRWSSPSASIVALLLVNLGLAAGWTIASARRRSPPGLQHLWRDFRDAYGVVWGLRVAERMNAAARKHLWPVEFGWNAVYVAVPREPPPGEVAAASVEPPGAVLPTTAALSSDIERLDPPTLARIERELCALLRRFVSREWIASRLAKK